MKKYLSKFTLNLAENIVKFKVPIFLIVLILTVLFGYYATEIKIDSDILNSLPNDDKYAKLYKEIGNRYESNLAVMVILETDNVLQPKVLEDIRTITDTIGDIDGVSTVSSLTNIINIKSSQWGLEIGKLVDEYNLPKTDKQLDSLAKIIFNDDMYRGVIVSEDTSATMIVANLKPDADKQKVAREIEQKVKSLNLKEKVYFTGIPVLLEQTNSIIFRDLFRLLPIATLVIIFILFLGFRSFRGVILPLLIVAISIIWTVGIMAIVGSKFTIVSDIIPVILLALGSAYTIHILNKINKQKEYEGRKKLVIALSVILIPVFLAYITTAFGFISFIFGSYLLSIKNFGIYTAIGITLAFVLSVLLVPAFLDLFKSYESHDKSDSGQKGSFSLRYIAKSVIKKPKYYIGFWLILALLSALWIGKIQRRVDMLSYYKKGSSVRVAQEVVDKKFGGVTPVFVLFDGDVQSPEFLKIMKTIEDTIKANPYVNYTMSVADLIARMNNAMGEGYKIPSERDKIEQLWFLLDGQDIMPQLVNDDLTEAVIQARFGSLDTKLNNNFASFLEKIAQKYSSDSIKITVTGMPYIYRSLDRSLIRSQFISLLLAIVLMLFIVSLTMWSFRSGLLSLIPLVITIIISFGFMGFVHIPLDIVTVLVASVTMGVGIDYAIHVISHYNTYRSEGLDIEAAIEETIKTTGTAILINVFAVAFGFLTLLFSNLAPLRHFGLMMALTMIIAGFASLTFLTATIVLIDRKKSSLDKK